MIKNLVKIFLLIFTNIALSQSGTNSPYSYTGLGEVNFRGNQINRFMGGLEVYNDSIHANLSNPSSYAKLLLTTYSIGLNYSNNQLSDTNDSKSLISSGLDYIGIAIPTKKFGFGFGIIPFTSVGYKLSQIDDSSSSDILNRYEGEGGINKVFFSLGLYLLKNLSFGVTINYDFGKLKYQTSKFLDDVYLGTVLINESSISGLDIKLATNYEIPVNSKIDLHMMVSYVPQGSLNSNNKRLLITSPLSDPSNIAEIIEIDLAETGLDFTEIQLPSSSIVGFGLGKKSKWFAGAQYIMTNSSNFKNSFNTLPNVSYKDGSQFSIGGFYIPDYSSITSYWKRVVLRMGFRHEVTGIFKNNFGINETGINFGAGLPLPGYSNVNIGFEYGSRGTKNSNILNEKFWTVRIGFSLNDRWFIKRKYN
ncbi:MAG: hypothetical protein CMC10_00500 [Flavobacteriaceae bacterium]|nr:hypothetical protein [Flavobacteriaceae bacterium]MEE2723257.1 hypothetical protein [Bacteroidota bacterium]|tara:strand:- start:1734 stop:2993 length:1260 start_codon:yes stop_codon:yes gene_type:complete